MSSSGNDPCPFLFPSGLVSLSSGLRMNFVSPGVYRMIFSAAFSQAVNGHVVEVQPCDPLEGGIHESCDRACHTASTGFRLGGVVTHLWRLAAFGDHGPFPLQPVLSAVGWMLSEGGVDFLGLIFGTCSSACSPSWLALGNRLFVSGMTPHNVHSDHSGNTLLATSASMISIHDPAIPLSRFHWP